MMTRTRGSWDVRSRAGSFGDGRVRMRMGELGYDMNGGFGDENISISYLIKNHTSSPSPQPPLKLVLEIPFPALRLYLWSHLSNLWVFLSKNSFSSFLSDETVEEKRCSCDVIRLRKYRVI